jgi:hypothetical protein
MDKDDEHYPFSRTRRTKTTKYDVMGLKYRWKLHSQNEMTLEVVLNGVQRKFISASKKYRGFFLPVNLVWSTEKIL